MSKDKKRLCITDTYSSVHANHNTCTKIKIIIFVFNDIHNFYLQKMKSKKKT